MTYPQFDPSKPDGSQSGTAALASARENLLALRDGIVVGLMPGWNMAPAGGTAEQPATITYSKGTEQIEMALTWGTVGGDDGNVTQAVVQYSADSGGTWSAIGTQTITYDSAANVTAITWS